MAIYAGPNSTESGLIFHYDPRNTRSYSGSGTSLFDLSGNSHTATLVNNTSIVNGSFYLDGTDDYITVGNNTAYNGLTGNLTVDMWWMTTDANRSLNYMISNARDCCGTYNGFELLCYVSTFPRVLMTVWDGTAGQAASNTQINSNQWYNIVFTHNGSQGRLYMNGAFDVSVNKTMGATASANLRLGAMGLFPVYEMIGYIDSVKMYNRVLTDAEIKDNYTALRGRFGL